MGRIATTPMHRALFDSIARSQQRLSDAQLQMATGKKVRDLAGLGTEAVRNLSAHGLLARQKAHAGVAQRLGTTLSLYDAHLGALDRAAQSLRNTILQAIGTGQTTGVQGAAEEAFQNFRTVMNADEGGVPLFAGSQTGSAPFTPASLAGTSAIPASSAFTNDQVRASARVADGYDIGYGITADEVGSTLYAAFQSIASAGPIGATATPAQQAALQAAVGLLGDGLAQLRSVNGENGRRQAQLEELQTRGDERGTILERLISEHEDADMGEVASELTQRQLALEASYSVYSKLSGLSLVNYLR